MAEHSSINIQRITKENLSAIEFIKEGYWNEWKIDRDITQQKILELPSKGLPFHFVMYNGREPIATGGVHHDVNLLNVKPRFKKFDPWLALVYTSLPHRGKGYGFRLCQVLQQEAKQLGLSKLYLYTVTAESLYARLGWRTSSGLFIKVRIVL